MAEAPTCVAVLGSGKMGSAIIRGLRACMPRLRIVATDVVEEALDRVRRLGAEATRDNRYAVSVADLVFICVKPGQFPDLVREVGREAWRGKLVVSVMAGVRLETLRRVMPGARVYRAMPSLGVAVRAAGIAVSPPERDEVVERVLSCLGEVYWLEEKLIDAWMSLASSGPAVVAELLDAMAMAGVAMGLPRPLAVAASLAAFRTVARLLEEGVYDHPLKLRDDVASPAGTTIEALRVLEERAVKGALVSALVEAYRKAERIARDVDEAVRRGIEGSSL